RSSSTLATVSLPERSNAARASSASASASPYSVSTIVGLRSAVSAMARASGTPTGDADASSSARFSAAQANLSREGTPRRTSHWGSGNDVRCQIVFDDGDLVLQPQFTLLQPRYLQLILALSRAQGRDRCIEV